MKLRYQLLLLMILYAAGIGTVTGLSFFGWRQTRMIYDSISLGEELQLKSKNIQSLMKDIVFDLFAPRIYGQLRTLTYSPRSAVTMKQWVQAVLEYEKTFKQFMDLEFFSRSRDELIRDQYLTALTMNDRAMGMLSRMEEILILLQDEYRTSENLYNTMQKNESLIPFFDEFQATSFYFTNSFEGFMDYFTRTLDEAARELRVKIYLVFMVTVAFILVLYLFITFFFTRRITSRLVHIEQTFQRISYGDFSVRMSIQGRDEFGELASRFNLLIADLKNNVDSILNLTRDITSWISEKATLGELIALICRVVVQDTSADAAVFLKADNDRVPAAEHGEGVPLSAEEQERLSHFLSLRVIRPGSCLYIKDCSGMVEFSTITSLIVVPLIVDGRTFGFLASLKTTPGEGFSDLGVTRFATFADYIALTIDNFFKYNELLEKREAQYLALQAQLQPHFMYNVLNGFVGLNRKEDRKNLEQAILALKDMLRYIQDNTKLVSLEEEFLFLEKYCGLQKIRFSDRFNYKIDLDAEARFVQVPRLFLQPLVENAIIHGIEPLEKPGHLEISGRAIRRRGRTGADISILDDGRGFDPEALEANENIGLRNFRQRMAIAFPEGAFTLKSHPNAGTRVEISL